MKSLSDNKVPEKFLAKILRKEKSKKEAENMATKGSKTKKHTSNKFFSELQVILYNYYLRQSTKRIQNVEEIKERN